MTFFIKKTIFGNNNLSRKYELQNNDFSKVRLETNGGKMKSWTSKFFILFSIFIIQYTILNSQDTWVKTYAPFGSGEDENYTVRNIAVCQDGDYTVNGTYIYDDSPYLIIEFGFLIKTDSDGNFLWAKQDTVNFIQRTESLAFVETDDGGFISAVTNSTIGGGNALIKRDSSGNREWVVDNDEFQVWSMARTSDGNIVLSGMLSLNLPAIRKIDQSGTEIWTQTYNPNNERETGRLSSIIETSDGGLAATGYIQGNGLDIFILKTDAIGDTMWTRTYDGIGYNDYGRCIIESSNNAYIVCGSYQEFISSFNIFLKYSSVGDLIWEHHFDEFNNVFSVIKSQDGNFVSSDQQYLFKFDSEHNLIWTGQYGSSGGDRSIEQLSSTGYVMCHPYISYSHFWIIKTNSTGYVPITENEIIGNNDFVLNCFPNPFNPVIYFQINAENISDIEIRIYNVKGQIIDRLIINTNNCIWNAENNPSGVYFCRLIKCNKTITTKKILLMK